jgi:diguanylate cyclase (GGDEF)-like protein
MSLIKQLWIAIALIMTAAFGTSLIVSVLSARHYLEQQLQLKNIDNATALALSLTQLDKDPVTVELQVAAQFDVGHYRFIRITSPTGQNMVEKVYEGRLEGAPEWFARLIPIHAEPGRALIQDGWKQFGTLTLASHDQYAYKSLWEGTLSLLMWFVLGSLATGVLGRLALRIITQPLSDVVSQAESIVQRRFLTIAEPRTRELRAVTHAMNDMVNRLKGMFDEEAARLEVMRQKINHDAVTGLSSRDYLMSNLRTIILSESFGSVGSLVVMRLTPLHDINAKLGHQRSDELLRQLGEVLFNNGNGRIGQRAGRIKGDEFAIICPTFDSPAAAAQDIHACLLQNWLPHWEKDLPDLFHIAAVRYHRKQDLGDLFTRADQALAQAQAKGPNNWHAVEDGSSKLNRPAEQWRTLLSEAIQGERLSLHFYPVVTTDQSRALHQEAVVRLRVDSQGELLSAGDFMPMAATLDLSAPVDLAVIKLALTYVRNNLGDVAINLSAETIADFGFRNALTSLLQNQTTLGQRLLFEVPEYGVFHQLDAFRDLVRLLKAQGCRVGIEYVDQRFSEAGQLAGLGLDYIKVHPSYAHDIDGNKGNQDFLRGLCNMAHVLGIAVIALGVEQPDDLPLLSRLGFDGATGPGVK